MKTFELAEKLENEWKIVAEGVIFTNGKVVFRPTKGPGPVIILFESMDDVVEIYSKDTDMIVEVIRESRPWDGANVVKKIIMYGDGKGTWVDL